MKEVTLTVLALTIRLKAVEITPAEWHVKQWVTLSVCDLIPCPVHCRLHSSYSPESPSLPTWEPLLTYAVGKRWHFFPRLQQKLCTKELTWEPTEREEVKVSDLLLSWLKYCSWILFSVTAKQNEEAGEVLQNHNGSCNFLVQVLATFILWQCKKVMKILVCNNVHTLQQRFTAKFYFVLWLWFPVYNVYITLSNLPTQTLHDVQFIHDIETFEKLW